jgi:hypothetical protein
MKPLGIESTDRSTKTPQEEREGEEEEEEEEEEVAVRAKEANIGTLSSSMWY